MHDHMKTITLTDDAYRRLIEWKTGATDSFSRVVLRIVPKKGTFGQLLEDVQRAAHPSPLNKPASWKKPPRGGATARHNRDPWTT
jgi:predicted CopG family antitoxin